MNLMRQACFHLVEIGAKCRIRSSSSLMAQLPFAVIATVFTVWATENDSRYPFYWKNKKAWSSCSKRRFHSAQDHHQMQKISYWKRAVSYFHLVFRRFSHLLMKTWVFNMEWTQSKFAWVNHSIYWAQMTMVLSVIQFYTTQKRKYQNSLRRSNFSTRAYQNSFLL